MNGQKLSKGKDFPNVVEKSNKFLKMVVDGIPDGYSATAYFSLSWMAREFYNISLVDGEAIIDEFLTTIPENPSEYFDYIVSVSVVAVNSEGTRITTNMVDILLDKSNYSPETENTPEIPQSQYDQFVSDITNKIGDIEEALDNIISIQSELIGGGVV